MTSVSSATSRAIYDDAMAAYEEEGHPCHVFKDLQPVLHPGDDPKWILPVPFLGATAAKGLVFLGLNPNYDNSPGDTDPRIGTAFEAWDEWARNYFERARHPWARLYRLYQAIGEAAFDPDFRLGRDALVLECIRFRSTAGQGTTGRESIPVWEHEMPITHHLIEDIKPSVIVTIGTAPFGAMHGMLPTLEPRLRGAFRLRSCEFQVFRADSSWGSLAIIPSRHLTGVWGNPDIPIARLGAAIRDVIRDRRAES